MNTQSVTVTFLFYFIFSVSCTKYLISIYLTWYTTFYSLKEVHQCLCRSRANTGSYYDHDNSLTINVLMLTRQSFRNKLSASSKFQYTAQVSQFKEIKK